MSVDAKIRAIDALLPQTQCGECDYAGCLPYATAIVNDGEAIDRCPPGGTETLQALAEHLSLDATPFLSDMQAKTREPSIAKIRESECIGCTKCIQACPVDAILGAGKLMHTVITDECTGCGLCVEPCPVDCIDLQAIPTLQFSKQKSRERFAARNQRIADEAQQKRDKHIQKIKLEQRESAEQSAKQAFIQAAIARAKAKKAQS